MKQLFIVHTYYDHRKNNNIYILNIHWKDWCWSWNSNTLATWCEELTHCKRPWCWERLKAGGEGDDRGCDCEMASLTWWTCVWVSSGSWWWTGRPGVLQSMGLQRVGHDWATELNWTFYSDHYMHVKCNYRTQNMQIFYYALRVISLFVICCLVTKLCPTLCNPMDCGLPGFPVLHYLPMFAQTYVHWIGDAIQSSHPLSHPSPPALNVA